MRESIASADATDAVTLTDVAAQVMQRSYEIADRVISIEQRLWPRPEKANPGTLSTEPNNLPSMLDATRSQLDRALTILEKMQRQI